jgi:hypothetical protein
MLSPLPDMPHYRARQQQQQQQQQQSSHKSYKIAKAPFDYMDRYRQTLERDPGLSAVLKICTSRELMLDPGHHDAKLKQLASSFNRAIKNKRNLKLCYDCGTNARALFVRLVQQERNVSLDELPFTKQEVKRMSNDYWLNVKNPVSEMNACMKHVLDKLTGSCVYMMSIGFGKFGHVWIVDKRVTPDGGGVRYHRYQSAFKSHMLIDFVCQMKYGSNPNQSLDVRALFKEVEYFLRLTKPWQPGDVERFVRLFGFKPDDSSVQSVRPGFCWTYVVY